MGITKLAIWVHPHWSSEDRGTKLIEFWQRNIENFAKDSEIGFILTGAAMDDYTDKNWRERLKPVFGSLPLLFGDRYLRWRRNFVYEHNKKDMQLIQEKFGVMNFQQGFVDGLSRGLCVDHQYEQIRRICRFNISYWPEVN